VKERGPNVKPETHWPWPTQIQKFLNTTLITINKCVKANLLCGTFKSLFITHCFPIFFVSHLTSPLPKVYEHQCWTLCSYAQDFPSRLYNTVWPSTKRPEKQQHLCEYASIEYTFCYVSETAASFLMFPFQVSGHKNALNASIKAFFLERFFLFLQNRLHKELMPYSLVEVYRRLGDIGYLHIQDWKMNQVVKQRILQTAGKLLLGSITSQPRN
jgi:hypothetical protein